MRAAPPCSSWALGTHGWIGWEASKMQIPGPNSAPTEAQNSALEQVSRAVLQIEPELPSFTVAPSKRREGGDIRKGGTFAKKWNMARWHTKLHS